MNEIVTNLLQSRLAYLEVDIDWARNRLSDLALSTVAAGSELDRLTTERRAIQDALEASA